MSLDRSFDKSLHLLTGSLPYFPVPARHVTKWNRRVKTWQEPTTGDYCVKYSVCYTQDPAPEGINIPSPDKIKCYAETELANDVTWSSPFVTRGDVLVLREDESLEEWGRKLKWFADRIRNGDLPIQGSPQSYDDAALSALIASRITRAERWGVQDEWKAAPLWRKVLLYLDGRW